MCTQDVRKWSNCGCTVKVGSVKDCDKKDSADCKGVVENRLHIGQVGAVTINLRTDSELEYYIGGNELYWDCVSTKYF